MANYATLKAAVQAVVKTNGNAEITGANMQSTLLSIINSVGAGYQFMGVATPSTSPGTPDYNVFYVGGAGTYANFGTSITVPVGSICVFKYNGSWTKEQVKMFEGIDDVPTANSTNLVKSGGVMNYISGLIKPEITISTAVAYQDTLLPYTIPAGTTILSITPSNYTVNGRTQAGASTYQSLSAGVVTDRDINYIRSSYVGEFTIILSGLVSMNDGIHTFNIVDGAVTTPKTNFDIFIDKGTGSTPKDYSGTIAELYVVAPIPDGSNIVIKHYNGNIIMRTRIGTSTASGSWQANNSMTGWVDGVVYKILCTTASASLNVNIGDTVAYVIFKNIAQFKSISDEGTGSGVDNKWVMDISNSPIIMLSRDGIKADDIADGAVTVPKLADKFVVSYTTGGQVYDIRGCIAELYLFKNAVYYNEAGGYTKLGGKQYNNIFYIRSYKETGVLGWTCAMPLSGKQNNVVYKIEVTTAGDNTYYNEGDTLGYLIFKDIEKISSISYGPAADNMIRENVIELSYSPMIYSYMLMENTSPSNVLTYATINIPSDIYVVSGNQLMIFYKSIVKAHNNNIYYVRAVCSVGKAYPDYYLLDASEVGNKTITFSIMDNDYNVISSKSSTIHIISAMRAPSTNKNVLVFGASATASGLLAGELKRRLTESTGAGTTQNPTGLGLSNITFVGRKTGTSNPVHQEATGGWSWKDYAGQGRNAYRFNVTGITEININDVYTQNNVDFTITEINVTGGSGNIRCTYEGSNTPSASGTLTRKSGEGQSTITYSSYDSETYNPFWNPNKAGGAGLDFVNYANQYCNGSIDIMISHCGINDLSRYTPDAIGELFEDYVKPFIRAYHTDFPNGKFIISTLPLPSPTGGMAANYGASATSNWLYLSLRMWAFESEAEALCQDNEFSSYVYLADDLPVFDCVHSYPYEMAYVNNRSTVQEERGTNGVHPTEVGSYQVSDAIYMTFNRLSF